MQLTVLVSTVSCSIPEKNIIIMDQNNLEYNWIENWTTVPSTPSAIANGRTHGVVVTRAGNILIFHQAIDGLLTYSSEGTLIASHGGNRWMNAHGMTLINENEQERLLLVDHLSSEVAKTDLDGSVLMSLEPPKITAYQHQAYEPTWADQNPENGDIWVCDGYGASLIHRYSKDGRYINSFDGLDSGQKYDSPHGIRVFITKSGPRLFIADRANKRIVLCDAEGKFLHAIENKTHSPCSFDRHQNKLLIPELYTGVKVFDIESFELIKEYGANQHVAPNADPNIFWPPIATTGWPDLKGTALLEKDAFNSPHNACFDHRGDIYVVEWIEGGGRIIKIEHT